MSKLSNQDKQFLLKTIRDVPNYPKPGIMFKDITTLINNPVAFKLIIDHLALRYKEFDLDYIAGIESRGFIFGAPLATALNVGFVPIRKQGKLPYTTISEKYSLEYGFDEVEIHIDAFGDKKDAKVLLIDDLIATGGTAMASSTLINKAGANCVECCFIVDLTFLNGAAQIAKQIPVYSVLEI